MRRVVVTGGSGFIGSAVARQLRHYADVHVIWAVHTKAPTGIKDRDEVIQVDVTDPSTLFGIASGADAVLHLAHAISGSTKRLQAVNDTGSRIIADEALSAGARLVTVGTASVYGPGPWSGDEIHALQEAPTSLVSATRAEGDKWILAAGGTSLRPHFVLGVGDRWVVPRASDLVARFGWPIIGNAVHSIIDVDDLADRLIAAAIGPTEPIGVQLAANFTPQRLHGFIAENLRRTGRYAAKAAIDLNTAINTSTTAEQQRLRHDTRLIMTDHYLTCRCPRS